MNETLQKWISDTRSYLMSLSIPKRIGLGLGLLALVGLIVAISSLGKKEQYDVLYTDLVAEDSSAILKKLGGLGIQYHLSPDRKTIRVPKASVALVRMELAKDGLPGGDVVGFERFDKTTFGMPSYVQRIQYLRAIQGELTRSIQRVESIKRARVHLSIPPKKTFLEEEETPKASVILELVHGKTISKKEVKGIAHLVASAVEALDVNQVTIVDNKGKFLHRPSGDGSEGLASSMLDFQRSIESTYERRIVGILTPVVGIDKVIAKVTAEIDRSRVNTTEESYDPERAVAVKSRRRDEVTSGSRPNPIGIPGSRSNLPGSEVENPPVPMATANTEKNDRDINYAVPRKVQTMNKPSGSIRRLTVAVVVDGHYSKNGQGSEVFSPRSEDELRRIQELVANSVGYDPQRRDSITVSSLPFSKTNVDIFPQSEEVPSVGNYWEPVTRYGAIVIGVLLFFLLILRPFLRWASLSEIEQELAAMPKTVAELESARRDDELLALSKAVASDEMEPFTKREGNELRRRIEKYISDSPRKGVQIIREWLADERLAKGEA